MYSVAVGEQQHCTSQGHHYQRGWREEGEKGTGGEINRQEGDKWKNQVGRNNKKGRRWHKGGRLRMQRVQVEWEGVSEWLGVERKATMTAYVTLRMTLAGRTGLLPHQFSRRPRGHHITHIISPFLSLPHPIHTDAHIRPAPGDVALPGRTHPHPPIGCSKAATLPLLPSQRDSAWKQRLRCYHYRPLLQHWSDPQPCLTRCSQEQRRMSSHDSA